MTSSEIDILRRLRFGSISEAELLDIFQRHRASYRVRFHLVQHPLFPEAQALNMIPEMLPMDLIRVTRNKRANPSIRKKAELEFGFRCQKMALGEKKSLLKMAPLTVLYQFVKEKDERLLQVIFENGECTVELVMQFLNRSPHKAALYRALMATEWPRRPAIVETIIHDPQAPIRVLIEILPYLNHNQMKRLYGDENTHQRVKEEIIATWKRRRE